MAEPNAKQDDRPSVWQDLKDIWGKATLLASIIAVPPLSFSAITTLALQPIDPLKQVVFGTWPLVASVTVLIMMLLRGSLDDKSGMEKFWIIAACVTIPYLIAYFFGVSDFNRDLRHADTKTWVQLLHPAHLLLFAVNIVVYYFSAFGLVRLASALLCGGFIAWAYEFRLLPHIQRLTEKRPE